MEPGAEVLAAEQRYFDHVSDHRERMRRALLDAPAAAANAGAAARLRKDAEARVQRIGEPDDAVAVGRMDDEDGETLYVGYHTIFDDDSEVLVVNWQAPAAARYFTATHADAAGLVMKRSFDCTGNVIDAFSDVVFRQLAAAVAELEEPGDALLDDLNRDRTGQMQDIVRTIQAAQFELIRAPLDEMLIIQGGPGTGKTAVALHRVSWLLYNYRDELSAQDVLIVGPTPTFTRYTRTVLPSLGDTSVVQRDIGQFHPPVKRGRAESAEVARLKGDGRMAGLLRRALYDRVGVPADQRPLEVQLDGRPVVFTADEIGQFVARSRQTPGTFAQQRQIFRSLMVNAATERARERRLGVRASLDQLIERVWPSFTAAAFLRELYGSRDRLIAAAGASLTARDIALLHRRPGERLSEEVWSDADLPLLDHLEAQINGIDERYGHIVVDEAQDLSPMQLRSIALRCGSGSMTVVGDIAQSTGLWARDDWDDVLEHLPAQLPQRIAELRYGYRVPRQVFEVAERLLPIAAPGIVAPQVVRDGPADPVFRLVDDDSRAGVAVEAAMAHASHGRSVAIICPAAHRSEIETELALRDVAWRAASRNELGQGVNLVSPQEAKGLEFDAAVVVEPKAILAEDDRGHRLLYVALTRTTRYLHVVGVLPAVGEPSPIGRYELTRTITVPPAIGTAAVPAPRMAEPTFVVPEPVLDVPALDVPVLDVSVFAVDLPRSAVDSPGRVVDAPESAFGVPGPVFDRSSAAVAAPGHVIDAPEPAFDASGLVFDGPRSVIDVPERVVDAPEAASDMPGPVRRLTEPSFLLSELSFSWGEPVDESGPRLAGPEPVSRTSEPEPATSLAVEPGPLSPFGERATSLAVEPEPVPSSGLREPSLSAESVPTFAPGGEAAFRTAEPHSARSAFPAVGPESGPRPAQSAFRADEPESAPRAAEPVIRLPEQAGRVLEPEGSLRRDGQAHSGEPDSAVRITETGDRSRVPGQRPALGGVGWEPVSRTTEPEPVSRTTEPEPVYRTAGPEPVSRTAEPDWRMLEFERGRGAAEPEPPLRPVDSEPSSYVAGSVPAPRETEQEPSRASEPPSRVAGPVPISRGTEPKPLLRASEAGPVVGATEREQPAPVPRAAPAVRGADGASRPRVPGAEPVVGVAGGEPRSGVSGAEPAVGATDGVPRARVPEAEPVVGAAGGALRARVSGADCAVGAAEGDLWARVSGADRAVGAAEGDLRARVSESDSVVDVAQAEPRERDSAGRGVAPGRGRSLAEQIVELVAAELAGQIRENVRPAQWRAVLGRVGELLDEE
ncbi:UvrD-helicase domain-containing protein [Actinoplanes sp. URMC 104]|uniref:UvrD-helicase domain-containing protein n=1 Tax=Actinoplanes sp. URMC 104 TaxID=3423409 RepID=UPI003F1B5ECC